MDENILRYLTTVLERKVLQYRQDKKEKATKKDEKISEFVEDKVNEQLDGETVKKDEIQGENKMS